MRTPEDEGSTSVKIGTIEVCHSTGILSCQREKGQIRRGKSEKGRRHKRRGREERKKIFPVNWNKRKKNLEMGGKPGEGKKTSKTH